ncbi:MAG: MobV family relaxase [Rikenellaceae bacterium]
MGYAVVHLEKAKGTDSGMSAHIERTIDPKNADKERTHLNKELIDFPDGVENRTQAIQHRLDTAGLTRKIGKNQVRAIRVLLTGSHEDMARIVNEGRFDKWCSDNIDWLRQTYGTDNLVSAVLHLDEKTPHIHATIIPIVTTERKRRKREETVKKKYKQKAIAPRLCTDEVMSRLKLKEYQNTYAEAMQKYGLERGIEGSTAKHTSTSKYYRDLIEQSENIQQDITALLELKEREQTELSKIRADQSKEKLKNSAADVGSKVMDSVSSMLGTPKVKRLEAENTQLKSDIADVRTEMEQVKEESQQRIDNYTRDVNREYNRRLDEFNRKESKLQQEIDRLHKTISKILDLVPEMMSHLQFTQLCKTIGLGIEMIRQLINGDEVRFNGDLYSELHNKRFYTDGSVAKRHQSNDRTENAKLLIDNKPHDEWFREQHQKHSHSQTIEPQQRRGRRM